MAMISDDSIELVKASVDEVSIIGDYVKLKKAGANYVGLCPFHSEKTPSFNVTPKKGFKCFGCGKSGDAIEFVREKEQLGYIETIRFLAEKLNITLEEERERDWIKPEPRKDPLSEKALAWFAGRFISRETVECLGITFGREWLPKNQKEVDCICFNFYRKGELINIKFRGPDKDFKLAKDAELIFYNLDSIEGQEEAVIVEGEPDCCSVHEAGIHYCVSVPQGASKNNVKVSYLDNCADYFIGKKKIYLFLDNDIPGKALTEELARRLGKDRCYLVEPPKDCKDANDVLKLYGKETLAKIIFEAKQYPLMGVVEFEEVYLDLEEWYTNGYPKGAKAHIPGFDDHLSFFPGFMTTITGVPGSGKDEFFNLIQVGLTRYEGWKFARIDFEEPAAVTASKVIEKYIGKSFDHRKDAHHRMSRSEFEKGVGFVDANCIFINPNKVEPNLEAILLTAEDIVRRKGIKGLLINPWNWLESNIPPGMSETNYIGQQLSKMLYFAYKFGVHIFLIAHPTKMGHDKLTNKSYIPRLYDIANSANFYNKTSNGMIVNRDSKNDVEVIIEKVKFHWWGKKGSVSFGFDTFTRQYIPYQGTPDQAPTQENPFPGLNFRPLLKAETEDDPF